MPDLLEQLNLGPQKKRGSLLSQLGLEEKAPRGVSSPLLPRPTLEELKTMELEGIPIGGLPKWMPRPAPVPGLFGGVGGVITDPLPEPWSYPIDIAEAILHLGKGIVALPAVGLESAERLGVALLAGMPVEEALAEAEKAGAWLGPGPATKAMEVTAKLAEIPHKVSVAITEAMAEPPKGADEVFMDFVVGQEGRMPLINVSPETARKVTVAAKTVMGTAIELGEYALIGKAIRKVVPKKKAKLTVKEVEKVAKEIEKEFPSAEEIKALKLKAKDRKLAEIIPTAEELASLRKKGVADAILERIGPKPKPPVEKAPKIPAFKSTEEAIAFGEKATPEQVTRMETLRKEHLKQSKKLRAEDKADEAMPHAVSAQFLREAVDASTGDLVIMRKEPTKVEVAAKETPPKVEPISEVVKSSEEGLIPPVPEVAPPPVPKPPKISERIRTLFEEGKDVPEISKAVAMSEEATAMALHEMRLSRGKKIVTMKEVESEAKAIIEKSKNLDEVHTKMRELTTRYEENVDAGFADNFELIRYREWGDEIMGKVTAARRKAGLVPEPDPEAPISVVTKEGVRETFTDPTDRGGFSTAKVAETYRKLNPEVGEVVENPNAPGQFVFRARPTAEPPIAPEIAEKAPSLRLVEKPETPTGEWTMQVYLKDGSIYTGSAKGKTWAEAWGKLKVKARKHGELATREDVKVIHLAKLRVDTLETGGFQQMYEALADRLKRRAGEKMRPDAREVLDKGKIVKQRKVKGRIYPPVYEAQLEILKGCRKLDQTYFHRAFENPIRTFEDAGGQAMLDLTTHEYHAREFAIAKMIRKFRKDRKEIRKGLKRKERERIMIHAVASEKGGPAKLKLMGIEAKDYPKLNAKERTAYDALRARYEAWYTRLNRMRKAIGKEPFPYTENYFTFIRDLSWLERIEARPMDMDAAILNAHFIKMGATPFRFAKPRSNARYRLEMDPFHVLEIYEDSAIRHIQLSPLIAQMRELQLVITDPVSGKPFLLQNENPVLAASLHSWTNHIAGMKSPTFKLSPGVESAMMRVNSNLAASILGANARSAMIQVSALRNTVAEIGFEYTMRGVMSLIDPAKRNFARKKSKVLLQRTYDVTVEDAIRGIRAGAIGEVQKVGAKVAMKPLQILDYETATACWQGAYEYAKGPMKFSETRARVYADDVVTRTQASAMPGDIAPIQRSVSGKFITLFQTFTINDWNFLVKDVMRIGREGPMSKAAFKNAMRFVAATTLFNMLMEDVLKIQSPFPTPIRAFRESLERGDDIPSLAWNVSKEFIEPIPIIGAARYGKGPGGPGMELLTESVDFIRLDPQAREWWELSGKWLGVPGTAQVAKTVRARKRGESLYGQVVGTYTRPVPAMKELRGLETLETMP